MGVDDLSLGLFLNGTALFVLRQHEQGHAQHDAFASPAVLFIWHNVEVQDIYFSGNEQIKD